MDAIWQNEALQNMAWGVWNNARIFAASLIAFAGIAALIFYSLKRGRERYSIKAAAAFVFPPRIFKTPQTRVDLTVFLFNTLIWIPIIFATIGSIAAGDTVQSGLKDLFGERTTLIHSGALVFASQFLVAYLANDLSSYVAHRLMHTNDVLWSVHRTHHSAEVLTFLTGDRNHPLEIAIFVLSLTVIGGVSIAAFVYLTGTQMHPALRIAFLAAGLLGEIADKLNHSHLRISFGPLNYVFQSSAMHQLHHSAETRHRDKNFAGMLSIFDWMFGTLYIPAKDEEYRLGLNEAEIGEGNPHRRVIDLYLEPFAYAWRALTRKRSDPAPDIAQPRRDS